MTSSKEKWRLISANLLGALGSGWILATGLELRPLHEDAWGDSILAFLSGGCLSIFISTYKRRRGLQIPARAFSFLALATLLPFFPVGISSLVIHPAVPVSLLSVFFCFSFLARAERVAVASKIQSLIFPVELAYAVGSSLSLLALSAVEVKTPWRIVSVGGALCGLAYLLDFFGPRADGQSQEKNLATASGVSILPVAAELSALTIATQVVSQMISQRMKSPAPLGAFDVGTTLAPIVCTFMGAVYVNHAGKDVVTTAKGLHLPWDLLSRWVIGLMLVSGLSLLVSHESPRAFWVVLPAVLIASCLYEAQCLVRLESLGQTSEGRQAIPVIFSIMAVSATLTYSCFLLGDLGSLGILLLLVVLFTLALLRRESFPSLSA